MILALIRRIRRALHVHHAANTRPCGTFLHAHCRCGAVRITWTSMGRDIWASTWAPTMMDAQLQVRLASETIRIDAR